MGVMDSIVALLVLALSFGGCPGGTESDGGRDSDVAGDSDLDGSPNDGGDADLDEGSDGDSEVETDFVPEPLPELATETDRNDSPIYVFLFTHTEDHINHELAEERYLRLAPMLEELADENPEAHLIWTLEFQGADARTVAERNPETRIVDMLREHARNGLIRFGYHAHHDPTYVNRPQNDLDETSTWEEVEEAIDDWVSCAKDPYIGGCIAETGGGITAIEEHFGPVELVTGVSVGRGLGHYETRGAHHAIARYLPNRLLGFCFPDHGPTDRYPDYEEEIGALMDRLSPSIDTSRTVFWMDDAIRINDGDPANGLSFGAIHSNMRRLRGTVESIDHSRPHVFNAMIGSKYIYTVTGTSPTIWAYSHPDEPELPPEMINDRRVIEENYENTRTALTYFIDEVFASNPGSRFIGPDELIELVAPSDYWELTDDQLDVIARWVILSWSEGPPPFVSDGVDFYSLRDATGLLARALSLDFPDQLSLELFHGPLTEETGAGECSLPASEIMEVATELAAQLEPDAEWQETPRNILPSSFDTSAGPLNAAQLLYAMAMVYASTHAGTPIETINVPTGHAAPETYSVLQDYGCLACVDTAWSLKPARIGELP